MHDISSHLIDDIVCCLQKTVQCPHPCVYDVLYLPQVVCKNEQLLLSDLAIAQATPLHVLLLKIFGGVTVERATILWLSISVLLLDQSCYY